MRAKALTKAARLVHPVFSVSEFGVSEPVGSIRTNGCLKTFPYKPLLRRFGKLKRCLMHLFLGSIPPFGGNSMGSSSAKRDLPPPKVGGTYFPGYC